MERAAGRCVQWIIEQPWVARKFLVFCGKGNNGGDGLAIARMLLLKGYNVSIFILEFGKLGSDDFQANLQRLHDLPAADIHFLQQPESFPLINKENVVVDALFGSGLNKPLEGLSAQLTAHINDAEATVVSIDLPSGLFTDQTSAGNVVVKAANTLTFQCYKLGLLVQENAPFVGDVKVIGISLHPQYLNGLQPSFLLSDEVLMHKIFKPRQRFAHKGTFGHALLIGGSYGKIGAAVLATKACLYTGAGLTTTVIPKCGYQILQSIAPEAMAIADEEEEFLTTLPDDIEKFSAIGIGPGMGTRPETRTLLSFVIRRYRKPLVIDADGLNCLAQHPEWLSQLPANSILTPHPKEFDRLFGEHKDDFARVETARLKAKEYNIIVVLKGHHTLIASAEGPSYFNSTGNAGMAKGGSGDVLTGILASLLAQKYEPKDAAVLGVYLHGWAGDIAAKKFSKEAMLPTHTIKCLSDVFLRLNDAGKI